MRRMASSGQRGMSPAGWHRCTAFVGRGGSLQVSESITP
jgi:hypothetical protein